VIGTSKNQQALALALRYFASMPMQHFTSAFAELLLCPGMLHAGVLRSRRNCGRGVSSGNRGDAQRAHFVQEDQVKQMACFIAAAAAAALVSFV
jgi:hypothetical protein